jgi:hypothetical protein
MPPIAKINGISWTSIAKVNGIAVASIASIGGVDKPSGGGVPWEQVLSATDTSTRSVGFATSVYYHAASFVAANSGGVNTVTSRMAIAGTAGAYTYSLAIYTNSSGSPGSALATISSLPYSALATSAKDIVHTFSSPPSISSGATYWIVIKADQIDGSNYLQQYYAATGAVYIKKGTSTPVWSNDVTGLYRAKINGTT